MMIYEVPLKAMIKWLAYPMPKKKIGGEENEGQAMSYFSDCA